jgi:5-(carboxyamino)imidazole ribonucleotide synthase
MGLRLSASAHIENAPAESPAPAGGPPVVAMVGAGQLARMTQQAAIPLGVRLRVLAVDQADPAVSAGAEAVIGRPDRIEDLRALALGACVVTFDHEGIPPELLAELEREGANLQPSPAAKLLAQDKLEARRRLVALGFPMPPWTFADGPEQAEAFAREHGWPLVAKLPRGGYDGRGVFELADPGAAAAALSEHPGGLIIEPRLEIVQEIAVLVARSPAGERAIYPAVRTVQRDAMCREIVTAPGSVPEQATAQAARSLAGEVAERIGSTGILAVELFETPGGLLVNELALRPHNTGHYSIEGCATSQFEQHLRAVLGWPLGSVELRAPAVATVNVVGPADGSDPAERLPEALAVPGAHVHLYAKTARRGRKLGHVTTLGTEPGEALDRARAAVAILEGSGT